MQQVDVSDSEYDLPGPTRCKVACDQCGQVVRDHREVKQDGRVLCIPCAESAYFSNSREINWPDMNWTPDKLPMQNRPESVSRPCGVDEDAKIINEDCD